MKNSKLVSPYPIQLPPYKSIRLYRFENVEHKIFTVQFVYPKLSKQHVYLDLSVKHVDDEYAATNSGDIYRVMSTVVEILIHFIQKNPAICKISITVASLNEREFLQRMKLYLRYVSFFSEQFEWNFEIKGDLIHLSR